MERAELDGILQQAIEDLVELAPISNKDKGSVAVKPGGRESVGNDHAARARGLVVAESLERGSARTETDLRVGHLLHVFVRAHG